MVPWWGVLKAFTLVGWLKVGTLVGHGPRPVIAVPLEGPKGTQKVLGAKLAGLRPSAGPRNLGKLPRSKRVPT